MERGTLGGGDEDSRPKKKRRIDLSIALPAALKKGQDAVASMRQDMSQAVSKAEAAMRAADAWVESSIAFDGYKSTCATRLAVGRAFLADTLAECPPERAAMQTAPQSVEPKSATVAPMSVASSHEAPEQEGHEGSAITCRVRYLLRLEGQAKSAVQDVDAVRSHKEILHEVRGVMSFTDSDALVAHQKWLKEMLDVCKQLRLGIAKSADALAGFIDQHAKSKLRKLKREEKEKEKQAIAQAKARSKVAAEKVKEFKEEPLFNLKMDMLMEGKTVTSIPKYNVDAAIANLPTHTPWAITSTTFHQAWRDSNVIQVTLGNFGGQYKKQKSTKAEGRGQVPMNSREGKQETDAFIAKVQALMQGEQADLGESANVMNHTWIFGYEPRSTQASMTPYGLGLFRILAEGEVHTVVVDSAACMKAWQAVHGEDRAAKITYEDLMKELLLLDEDGLKLLASKGAGFMYLYLSAWQTLYIPPGWFVMERASDSALIYGCRKTTAHKHSDSFTSYSTIINIYRQSGKPVHRMEAVVPKLQPALQPEQPAQAVAAQAQPASD